MVFNPNISFNFKVNIGLSWPVGGMIRVWSWIPFSQTGHHKIEGSKNKKHPRCSQVGCFIWLTKLCLNHLIWPVLIRFGVSFVKQNLQISCIWFYLMCFKQDKLFSKEKEKTTKKKKKVLRVAGRSENARLFRLTFKNVDWTTSPNGKKTGTLAMALQFQDAVALAARPAKLDFLLGLS